MADKFEVKEDGKGTWGVYEVDVFVGGIQMCYGNGFATKEAAEGMKAETVMRVVIEETVGDEVHDLILRLMNEHKWRLADIEEAIRGYIDPF